jgi:hypothetical protein
VKVDKRSACEWDSRCSLGVLQDEDNGGESHLSLMGDQGSTLLGFLFARHCLHAYFSHRLSSLHVASEVDLSFLFLYYCKYIKTVENKFAILMILTNLFISIF